MKKEIEGKTYILQDKVEEIVKERISKHAAKTAELQTQLTELQTEYESSKKVAATATDLQSRLTDLESKLATTSSSFNKYKTISSQGITNPDVIDLLQWSYDKSQQNVKKGEQKDMSDWLTYCIQNPKEAPVTIRPHLPAINHSPGQKITAPVEIQHEPAVTPAIKTPAKSTNAGAVAVTPEVKDVWSSVKSLDDYSQNRDQIRNSWLQQFKRG